MEYNTTKMNVISLFRHNIYKYKINPKLYKKKEIVNTINSNFALQKYRNFFDSENIVTSDLHHSYKDEENDTLKSPDYSSLIPLYTKTFKKFYSNFNFKINSKINYRFQIVNYTCTNKNQFMRKHHHLPAADFSCVHYLQYDEEHSPTLFHNPGDVVAKAYKAVRGNFVKKLNLDNNNNLGYAEYAAPKYKEDDMIIFPGYLDHEIPPSKTEYKRNRITLVINTWIE